MILGKKIARLFLVPMLIVSLVAPSFGTVYAADQSGGGGNAAASGAAGGATACLSPAFAYAAAHVVLWIANFLLEVDLMPETAAGWAEGANATINTGVNWQNLIKECILDTIAWALVNFLLEQMLHSLAQWVASGFEGGPTFLTDPEGFFTDVADIFVGEALFGGDLRVLCSPFQLQLQLNILLRYFAMPAVQKNYCKLSDVVTNVQNFLEGSFEDGGWPAWFTTSIQPRQNYWGSLIGVEGDIAFRISSRTGTLKGELNMADGFFNIRDKLKKYVAPGKFVQESVNKEFFAGQERLTIADEIDEVVSAFLGLIMNEVLGPGGLLGLGEKKYDNADGSKSSYLDRLGADSSPTALKQKTLTLIDALLVEAGANVAYADQISTLTNLRTNVEVVNTNDPNALYILNEYYGQANQIAAQMGMSGFIESSQQTAVQSRQQSTGVDGPTPPPSDALPNTPGNDPNGTTVQNGGTTNTETPNGDVDLPPPPPPPSGF